MISVICAVLLSTPLNSDRHHWRSYVPIEVWQHYDVEKWPLSKRQRYIELAEASLRSQPDSYKPVIPNHYRKNTPVPYMPGAGQPLIDREEPKLQSLLVGP